MAKKDEEMPVTVEYDPSVIRKGLSAEEAEKRKKEYLAEKRELVGGSKLEKLGMESSLGKDERKIQLLAYFDKGEAYTLDAAAKLMNLSANTIKSYAKELGISMYDVKKGEWLEGRQSKSFK